MEAKSVAPEVQVKTILEYLFIAHTGRKLMTHTEQQEIKTKERQVWGGGG
jgi:hypothetical protein